jgi:hypothetical protein
MIYGRFGQPVQIKRVARINDIKRLENRAPDERDRTALALGSYVVVTDNEKERLYHIAYLRADGGSLEIDAAIRRRGGNAL